MSRGAPPSMLTMFTDDARSIPFTHAGEPPPLKLAAYGALPLLLVIVYGNLSDVATRAVGTPSLVKPLIALLLLAALALRETTRPVEIVLAPLMLLLAAYCVTVAVSSNWAALPSKTDIRTLDLTKDLVIAIVIGLLAVSWRAVAASLCALGLAAAFFAMLTIAQTASGTSNDMYGLATLTNGSVYGDVFDLRPSGPLGDPNFYGQMLLISIPLLVALVAVSKRIHLRIAFASAALIVSIAVLLTYSRGAIVALGAMACCAALIMRVRLRLVAAGLATGALLLALLPGAVTSRILTMADLLPARNGIIEKDASIEKRKLLAAVAWQMFTDHPAAGVGSGNFYRHFAEYANTIGSAAPQYEDPSQEELPHSLYLQIAAETGVAGLSTFLCAVAAAFVVLARARRNLLASGQTDAALIAVALAISLIGYLLTSLFLHGAFERNFWILMGLTAATERLAAQRPIASEVAA